MANPVIRVHWNTEIEEIGGEHEVTHVNVIDRKTGNKQRINLSAVFIAIGHQPNSTPFRQWLDTDEQGYIKTIAGSTKTRIEGVFACGDVQDRIYRQAITAAGSGCMAAGIPGQFRIPLRERCHSRRRSEGRAGQIKISCRFPQICTARRSRNQNGSGSGSVSGSQSISDFVF